MLRSYTLIVATVLGFILLAPFSAAKSSPYGAKLCHSGGYYCYQVKRGDTWERLFPNWQDRDVVQKVNRTDMRLRVGQTIAIPNRLGSLSAMDVSPLPYSRAGGRRTIVVNLSRLAWGAYDESGSLVNWGPVSGGKGYCPDVKRRCNTPRGNFTVYEKRGPGCFSTKYPVGKGGAPMPHCMFFRGGYAMHGSYEVPGYHASHGCIRLFNRDAHWLNRSFVRPGSTRVVVSG